MPICKTEADQHTDAYIRRVGVHGKFISLRLLLAYVEPMRMYWARFGALAARPAMWLVVSLMMLVLQPAIATHAAPGVGTHDQHQLHAAQDAHCLGHITLLPSGSQAHDNCIDETAVDHCSVNLCCAQSVQCLALTELFAASAEQCHRFKHDSADRSCSSSPQDRPPRLI